MDPRSTKYADYGKRGIKVCKRWLNPVNFIKDMQPTWTPGLELERVDNDGNYTKSNCIWTTRKRQMRNRRVQTWVTTPAGKLSLPDAVEQFGKVNYSTAKCRIHRGMIPWLAVITPKLKPGPRAAR